MTSAATRLVRGACPHDCPDTCATITEVQDGRAVRFYAEEDNPITDGWLCAKVRPYLERVYHPDRLLYPQRRVGPKGAGRWARISWEEAIDEITARWKEIIARYGAAAILPYSYSGTLGLLQLAVCNARLWNRMGASGLERSICGAAAEAAVEATLGARWAPAPEDVLHSKLVLIWGHNPASTGPHFLPLLRQAQKQGAHVVVIDPRRTITARSANEHLQPRPATDGALALGLMHVLFAEGLYDEAWLEANTVGWHDLRQRAAEYPPERVAAITGLSEETIISLARRYGTTKPALLKFADGVQRHGNGGQTVRALASLPAVVGQIGVRGGGLSYSTSGYAKLDAEAVGHASECPPTPRIINMNRIGAALQGEAHDPPIMSLFVFCANPVTSAPNASQTIKGLQRDDLFTVVHELFLTDTADYADIVLPATSQLEQIDLHKAYGHRTLQYNHPAIAPVGESKSNWDVMRLLAKGMGYTDPWLQQEADEVLAEVIDATRAHNPFFAGVTLERLKREGSVPLSFTEGTQVPFANLHFPTPSGKVELRSEAMAARGLDPLPDYAEPAEFRKRRPAPAGEPPALHPAPASGSLALHPDPASEPPALRPAPTSGSLALRSTPAGWKTGGTPHTEPLVLISGAAHHFVSSSMANQPSLIAKEGTPSIEINRADAAARGIAHGDTVIVANERGSCELRAVVTEGVMPGVAIAPKGHWGRLSPDGRNVNYTTSDALADLAGQSTFHSNLVEIRKK
jgi:anaerobic selenocysteine-containing dehydrogenase